MACCSLALFIFIYIHSLSRLIDSINHLTILSLPTVLFDPKTHTSHDDDQDYDPYCIIHEKIGVSIPIYVYVCTLLTPNGSLSNTTHHLASSRRPVAGSVCFSQSQHLLQFGLAHNKEARPVVSCWSRLERAFESIKSAQPKMLTTR